jgi:NAD(P)-dependent dehydrogenase (short-subunit alcohol dehydrogenase family)
MVARRLAFGSTVVHGIDVMLRVIDEACRHGNGRSLASLKATFSSPLLTGGAASIEKMDVDAAGAFTTYRVMTGSREIQRVTLSFADDLPPEFALPDAAVDGSDPKVIDFESLTTASGSVPLAMDSHIVQRLYPNILRGCTPLQVATLLATTRIVGMECPGLHSIYTELNLVFEPLASDPRGELTYRVSKADRRFKFLTIAVQGPGVRGHIGAIVRPAPVDQLGFSEARALVDPSRFVGQRAIVVGGSRGLGEVVAKLLAAGGADVAITYASGVSDADRVCEEISLGEGRCRAFRLDVFDPPEQRPEQIDADWKPTHVYYFASPRITLNARAWDDGLFAHFCGYYLGGVERVMRAVDALFACGRGPLTLYYPSTVFVCAPISGVAEYAAAKAAGEALCQSLKVAHPSLTVLTPRLPRMLTDQTAGLSAKQAKRPQDVMLDTLLV